MSASKRLSFVLPIFREDFSVRPFRVRHALACHPLVSYDRLSALAKTLPEEKVEWNAGDLPVGIDAKETPRNGLSPEETVRRIQECRSWMALKNVEADAETGALVHALLDEVAAESERIEPGMRARESFVFVSSPGSITPYHIDPEHNFLLQIRGTKTVHLFDGSDRSLLSEEELEGFYSGAGRNLKWRPELQARARTYVLRPGDGLYFPVTHPHWVQNGNAPSVSLSITFRTPKADAKERLHKMNAKLRALGVPVAPVGERPRADALKLSAIDAFRAAKRVFTRDEESPGRYAAAG